MTVTGSPVGELLRGWREHRRLSQLQLAIQAEISTRHLSFVETGRSRPSREMVLHLCEELEVPLRERNRLLLAAGFAPAYQERALDEAPMAPVLAAVRQVLTGHEPYPAMVVDGGWILVEANTTMFGLFAGIVAPELLVPPVNVLRASLHPDGAAPHIVNLGEWRAHTLGRLRRQATLTGDEDLAKLFEELRGYPCDQPEPLVEVPGPADVVTPYLMRDPGQEWELTGLPWVWVSRWACSSDPLPCPLGSGELVQRGEEKALYVQMLAVVSGC